MDGSRNARWEHRLLAAILAAALVAPGAWGCEDTALDEPAGATSPGGRPAATGPGGNASQGGGSVPEGSYLDILLGTLASGTRTERAEAAWELGDLGDPGAVPSLIEALRDESWDVRAAAAAALGRLPDPESVQPLLQLIAVEPAASEVREGDLAGAIDAGNAAIESLGIIGNPAAAARLAAIAADEATALDRDAAGSALAAIGEAAVPAVAAAIADAPAAAAARLVVVLAGLGDAALDPLAGALRDRRSAVQVAAARALGGFGPAAVKPLVTALGARSTEVRAAAARSLGEIGDARATGPLVKLLATSKARPPAVTALVAIHGDDATPLVRYLRSRSTVQVYRPLIRIGQGDTVPALVKALKRFGSKAMGETYLNCGERRLERAARQWAGAHGYIVMPGMGAAEEVWGG